jgi:hypothetical protein
VPQVVEPDPRQPQPLDEPPEVLIDHRGLQRLPQLAGEHPRLLPLPHLSERLPPLLLERPVPLQQLGDRGRDRQDRVAGAGLRRRLDDAAAGNADALPADREQPLVQLDVRPVQAGELATAQPQRDREPVERFPVRGARLDDQPARPLRVLRGRPEIDS